MANDKGTAPDRESPQWQAELRARIQARGNGRPTLKARQIRALWPEIRAALVNGQTLRTIRRWLEEEGVAISYGTFTSYVSRLRSMEKANPVIRPQVEKLPDCKATEVVQLQGEKPVDPLKNVRERNANRPGFDYPPGVDEESLI